ncbi:kinase-like domain-containing protein [Coniochaeta sp. 2T2.1]|nr:kinase-like domain-containing protein [Coniochaeta sp. 2T2.1]
MESRYDVTGQEAAKYFIPRLVLERIISKQAAYDTLTKRQQTLQTHRIPDIEGLAQTICHTPVAGDERPTFRKIFAILVRIGKPEEIVSFVEYNIDDQDLPLANVPRPGTTKLIYLSHKDEPLQPLQFLQSWESGDCEYFDKEQWTVFAPYFAKGPDGGPLFYDLTERDVLPWSWPVEVDASGGYSRVSRITIHENHHEFEDSTPGKESFAVKWLDPVNMRAAYLSDCSDEQCKKEGLRKAFTLEVEALRRFSGDKAHKHLVSLLTACKHGPHYYLVFPWAHEGNLKEFWKNTKLEPPLEKKNIAWIISQCHGVADGLRLIHQYPERDQSGRAKDYGRHTDIKPQNFLVYKKKDDPSDLGTIKLSDFGLCDFHRAETRSRLAVARLRGVTATYRPPEYDIPGDNISRSFDIWMLACVYLEFITWYLGGYEYVEEFGQARSTTVSADGASSHFTFDEFFDWVAVPNVSVQHDEPSTGTERKYRVKPAVIEWIEKLKRHEHCSKEIRQFLELIRISMLIVEDNNKIKRATSSEVCITGVMSSLLNPTYDYLSVCH